MHILQQSALQTCENANTCQGQAETLSVFILINISTFSSLQRITIKGWWKWIKKIWSHQDVLRILAEQHQFDVKYDSNEQITIDKGAIQKGFRDYHLLV